MNEIKLVIINIISIMSFGHSVFFRDSAYIIRNHKNPKMKSIQNFNDSFY